MHLLAFVPGRFDVEPNICELLCSDAGGNEPGGEAIGFLALDGQPPRRSDLRSPISDLLKLEAVSKALVIKMPPAGEMPAWMQ